MCEGGCVHVSACVCRGVCACVQVGVCICGCVPAVCICVCMGECICDMCAGEYVQVDVCMCVGVCMYAGGSMHVCMCLQEGVCIWVHVCECIRVCICVRVCDCVHAQLCMLTVEKKRSWVGLFVIWWILFSPGAPVFLSRPPQKKKSKCFHSLDIWGSFLISENVFLQMNNWSIPCTWALSSCSHFLFCTTCPPGANFRSISGL